MISSSIVHKLISGPTLTVGPPPIVTVAVAVFVQLLPSSTVTVYVVLVVGFTVFVAPVPNPLLQ